MKGIVGLGQLFGGKNDLRNLERPEYKIPDEIMQAVGMSRAFAADPRFAGQSNLERQTNLNTSNALNAATSRGNGAYQVGSIQAGANQAAQNIGAEQARQDRADRGDYANALNILAKYRDTEFQMNKFAPYQDKYNEGRERIGAGQTNLYGGLDDLATITTRLLATSQGEQPPGVSQVSSTATSNMQQNDYFDTQLANFMRMMAGKYGKGNLMKNAIYNAF